MKPLSNSAALPVSATFHIDQRARALAAEGRDIISFCVGEPDVAAPEAAAEAGVRAVRAGDTRYTHVAGTLALRQAIADALLRDAGVSYRPAQIAVTTGAKFAVYAAALVLCDPGDEVILPAPCWTSYAHLLRLAGARPVIVPCGAENGYRLTPAQLSGAVTPRTKALILNDPCNPTGAVYPAAELSALADVCRQADLYVIADEIYASLVYAPATFTAAAVSEDMYARTVTVGGVSKRYAMSGWRIGYAAGPAEVIRAVTAVCSHTTGCPAAPSQAAAAAALTGPQASVERMRRLFCARRDRLLPALNEIPGVSCVPPDGAFYALCDVRGALTDALPDDRAFAAALLEREGVAVVPDTDFCAPGTVRLSYTLPEQRMLEGATRMARFVRSLRG